MKNLTIFYLIFTTVFVYANSLNSTYKLTTKHLSKSKCVVVNKEKNIKVCQSYNIDYLECKNSCSAKMKKILNIAQSKILQEYNKEDPSKDLQDWEDTEFNKELNSDGAIELYKDTPTTLTFKYTYSGYGGGAHGWYGINFINIDKSSGKKIKIDDLFVKNSQNKLNAIAKRYYKLSKNIPVNASLSEADNWFEDKFTLAKNFAITKNGLYFVYNQYEIKAYAFGETTFLLPYEAIKDIIKQNSNLSFVFSKGSTKEYSFKDKFYDENKNYIVNSKLRIEHLGSKKIKATFKFKTNIKANNSWFSISLPQYKSAKNIKIVSKKGFDRVSIYKAGSKIYNIKKKKAIKSKYLLIEGSSKKTDKNFELSFIIKKVNVKNLLIDFRVSLKKGKQLLLFPEYTNEPIGQQGFIEHRVIVHMY